MLPCALAPFCHLVPGTDHELVVASFQAISPVPVTAPLRFCTIAGIPPQDVVVAHGGVSEAPGAMDGSVFFEPPGFIRGDANHDGALDLADVLFLGDLLFGAEGPEFPCREACEVNGDALIDVADLVAILGHLFLGAPPPGAPFPSCGGDPDPTTGWGCEQGVLCP
jgi:hypothetical protein